MSHFNYDLIVVGAGSGGVRASRIASQLGARVAICEKDRVGGTCVIRGCIPKKLMVYAAQYKEDFEDSAAYGWENVSHSFNWEKLLTNKDNEIDRLNKIYIDILKENNVTLFNGSGCFIDNHTIDVQGNEITAEKILISTGGAPVLPKIPGIEYAITSNEAFHLNSLPRRVVIVGGGYISVEFASIFNSLGSSVVQLYRGTQILRGFDLDIRNRLAKEMNKKGISIRVGVNVAKIENKINEKLVYCTDGTVIETDIVMFAIGREPNTQHLGLEGVGVQLDDKGAVIVDEWHKTNIGNIHAIGDVTDHINLTPVALNEGICFAETVFGDVPKKMDYSAIASAVFSLPNVATVGLTEEEAQQEFKKIDIYKSQFRTLRHTLTGRDELTFMKIVVNSDSQKVLGFHMVGFEAAEIIQGLAVALKIGVTKKDLDSTIGIHPTSAEEFVTMRKKST